MKKLQFHPYCNLFPERSKEEKDDLAQKIHDYGQKFPITLYEGKILDGKHRYEACLAAGMVPKTQRYKGDDPIAFIFAANFDRRHLTPIERASIALKLIPMLEEEALKKRTANLKNSQKSNVSPKASPDAPSKASPDAFEESGKTSERVAEMTGVSASTVERLKSVQDANPKLADQVVSGELSLAAAKAKLKEKASKNKPVLDATGYAVPPELVDLWKRKNEVMEMLRDVAAMRTKLSERQEEKDVLFSTIRFTDALMALDRAHQEIRNAQLWAVCTSCQGRDPSRCKFCKGRGILSKFAWDSFVPEEIKAVRNKAAK